MHMVGTSMTITAQKADDGTYSLTLASGGRVVCSATGHNDIASAWQALGICGAQRFQDRLDPQPSACRRR